MNHRRGFLQALHARTGRAVRPTIWNFPAFIVGYLYYYRTYSSYSQKEVAPAFPARALIVHTCTSGSPLRRHVSVTMTATASHCPRAHGGRIQFMEHRLIRHRICATNSGHRSRHHARHSRPNTPRPRLRERRKMSGSSVLPCKTCKSCKRNGSSLKSLELWGSFPLQGTPVWAVRPVIRASGARR
jgi:hypothetical protein